MPNISLRELLEAGVHFGHQTRRWNPKMRPYIYGQKNGIHIIDLQKTAQSLIDATRFVSGVVAAGQPVLFVGTKRAAREIVAEEAERSKMFYINNRWLGGTLTNFKTIKQSIDRLNKLERAQNEGRFAVLSKKEALQLTREISKMNKALGGIKAMKGKPGAIFVVDPKKEHIAIREAVKLDIPVVALCDTNCDPTGISYIIPGNDDAIKSIRLFTAAIADAAIEGTQMGRTDAAGVVAPSDDVNVDIVHRVHSPSADAADHTAAPSAFDSDEDE
jgi:small subunit ribosomal protein S2